MVQARRELPRLLSWLRGRMSEADAEDIAQETLVTLWRRAADVEPGSLFAWMRRTATGHAGHMRRARERREDLPPPPAVRHPFPRQEDVVCSSDLFVAVSVVSDRQLLAMLGESDAKQARYKARKKITMPGDRIASGGLR